MPWAEFLLELPGSATENTLRVRQGLRPSSGRRLTKTQQARQQRSLPSRRRDIRKIPARAMEQEARSLSQAVQVHRESIRGTTTCLYSWQDPSRKTRKQNHEDAAPGSSPNRTATLRTSKLSGRKRALPGSALGMARSHSLARSLSRRTMINAPAAFLHRAARGRAVVDGTTGPVLPVQPPPVKKPPPPFRSRSPCCWPLLG